MGYFDNKASDLLWEFPRAFLSDHRCKDYLCALKGICSLHKSKNENKYLVFLDILKAFDMLDRKMLFTHIWVKGTQGKESRIVKLLYTYEWPLLCK